MCKKSEKWSASKKVFIHGIILFLKNYHSWTKSPVYTDSVYEAHEEYKSLV